MYYFSAPQLFEGFIEEYFEQNPISQLGLIVTRNKRAERLTDLSGNGRKHIATLKSTCSDPGYCIGEPSLQVRRPQWQYCHTNTQTLQKTNYCC